MEGNSATICYGEMKIEYFPDNGSIIKITDPIDRSNDFRINVWLPYFTHIYKSLLCKMDKPANGLNLTVMYYFLPQGYIGNSMFRVLDQNRDGLLSSEEFVNGLSVLYFGEFEDKLRFIFNMYDYDSDGTITCEDIRLMLSYIPIGTLMPQSQIKEGILTSSTTHSSYFDRVQIQKQIIELFKITLKDKQKINFTEFKNIIENDSSDMFLCVFLVVRQSLPSMKNFMNYKSDYKMSPIDQKPSIIASPKMTKLSPTLEVLRVSPNMVHRSIINESNPFLKYFKSRSIEIENTIKSNSKTISDELPRDINIPIMKTQPSTFLLSKALHNENCVRIPNITIVDKNFKKSEQSVKIDYTESPTSFLAQTSGTQLGLCLCKCGRFCETGNTICKLCLKSNEIEGYLYTQLSEYKLKKYWYKLKGDELFCFEDKSSTESINIISIKGAIIADENSLVIDKNLSLYPFSITVFNKSTRIFAYEKEDEIRWTETLRKQIGSSYITDYYTISASLIGKGKFSKVKLGTHKKTNKLVAIKVLNKEEMSTKNIQMCQNEIEILKMCQHSNIVKLLDLFESPNSIYLILEYLRGGDLFAYLEQKEFNISESRAASIISSLANSLWYLSLYGIAHRDIKAENILLVNKGEYSEVKLSDFGLSKILAPNEKATDPFGTLTYVSPEILLKKPYDNKIDIWSLGVLSYLLLSGGMPFEADNDSKIADLIVETEPLFTVGKWKMVSEQGKDLVKRMLHKDSAYRIGITEVIKHPFFELHKDYIDSLRTKSKEIELLSLA